MSLNISNFQLIWKINQLRLLIFSIAFLNYSTYSLFFVHVFLLVYGYAWYTYSWIKAPYSLKYVSVFIKCLLYAPNVWKIFSAAEIYWENSIHRLYGIHYIFLHVEFIVRVPLLKKYKKFKAFHGSIAFTICYFRRMWNIVSIIQRPSVKESKWYAIWIWEFYINNWWILLNLYAKLWF